MSNNPASLSHLPTAAQVQELIDLLIETLQQARNTEVADAIKEFVANLEAILAQLGRVAEELDRVTPAASELETLESRIDRLDVRTRNISAMLTEIHSAMLAPIDPG